MSEGLYKCKRCGWSEIDASQYGCNAGPCPMEIRRWWDRLLFKWFGRLPRSEGVKRYLAALKRLKARRARRVSLTWAPGAENLTIDQRAHAAADFLEPYLDGKFKVVKKFSPE